MMKKTSKLSRSKSSQDSIFRKAHLKEMAKELPVLGIILAVALVALLFAIDNSGSDAISACVDLDNPATYGGTVTRSGSPGAYTYTITGDTTLCTGTYSTTADMILIGSNGVDLDCNGSTLDGDDDYGDIGVDLQGSDNVKIINCRITDFEDAVFSMSASDNSEFINNTLYSYIANGFIIWYSDNLKFQDNNATGGLYGFHLRGTSGNRMSDLLFINNTVTSHRYAGFYLREYFENVTFINNTAIDNADGGTNSHAGFRIQHVSGVKYINNTAINNGAGFYTIDVEDGLYINNTADRNNGYQYGFYLMRVTNLTFINNTATNHKRSGFRLDGDAINLTLINNTANYNYEGFASDWSGIRFNFTFINNTANYNNGTGFTLRDSRPIILINNTAQENKYQDLSIRMSSEEHCTNVTVENMIGSGGRPIVFYNTSVVLSNTEYSQVLLCNADNSILTNITVRGSDTLYNNLLRARYTDNLTITDSNSSGNEAGFYVESGTNITIVNNTASSNEGGIGLGDAYNSTVAGNTVSFNMYGFEIEGLYNSTVAGNTASNNTEIGFYAGELGEGVIFANNTAAHNGNSSAEDFEESAGFLFGEVSNITFSNNTVYGSLVGFILFGCANNTLAGSTVYNNTFGFLELEPEGNLTTIIDSWFYNNTWGAVLLIEEDPVSFRIINTKFGSDSVSVSLYDAVEGGYAINDTSSPGAAPGNYSAFGDKYLKVSFALELLEIPDTGESQIDSLTFHWSDAEVAVFDEPSIILYTWNITHWVLTPDQTTNDGTNNLTILSVTNITDDDIYGLFAYPGAPTPPGEGEEEEEQDGLSVSLDSTCDGNTVTVTSNGEPVEGAEVSVVDTQIISGTTDSNGEFEFTGCGMAVTIYANKDGYLPESKSQSLVSCSECVQPECLNNDDCPENYECDGGICVPEEEPECIDDKDCPAGYECKTRTCVQEEEPECTSDNDCADDEYCDNEECAPVIGECGYSQGHSWIQYECGDEPGCPACPQGEVCLDNRCEAGNMDCPGVFYLDEEGLCTATLGPDVCANCDYQVIDPAGEWYTGKTDEDGSILLPFELEGEYKVALLQDGEIVKEVTVNVLPKAPPTEEEKPTEEITEDALSWLWLIVILAVLAVAFLYWRGRKGTKPKKK